jgi:hypothetical protein
MPSNGPQVVPKLAIGSPSAASIASGGYLLFPSEVLLASARSSSGLVDVPVLGVQNDADFGHDTVQLGGSGPGSIVLQAVSTQVVSVRLGTSQVINAYSPSAGKFLASLKQGLELHTKSVTASYVVDSVAGQTDLFLACALTAPSTITLPACSVGRVLFVSDTLNNFASNPLTLTPAGGNTLSGSASSKIIPVSGWSGFLMGDATGTNWILSSTPPTGGVLTWGANDINTAVGNRFLFPGGYSAVTASATDVWRVRVPRAGTLHNLYVKQNTLSTSALTVTYTLLVNGVASALTVTQAGNVSTGADTSHAVAVAAGAELSLQVSKAAIVTPAVSQVTVTIDFS